MQGRRMKKVSFAILLTLFFCSVATAAIKDSPDGFRGIKWGDPLSALGASMLVEETNGIQVYIKDNDNLKIADANLTAITYMFMGKKFIGTMLMTNGSNNSIALKSALLLRYGADFEEVPGGIGWVDTNATIIYQYLTEHNMSFALIGNTINFLKMFEVMEKSAASDF